MPRDNPHRYPSVWKGVDPVMGWLPPDPNVLANPIEKMQFLPEDMDLLIEQIDRAARKNSRYYDADPPRRDDPIRLFVQPPPDDPTPEDLVDHIRYVQDVGEQIGHGADVNISTNVEAPFFGVYRTAEKNSQGGDGVVDLYPYSWGGTPDHMEDTVPHEFIHRAFDKGEWNYADFSELAYPEMPYGPEGFSGRYTVHPREIITSALADMYVRGPEGVRTMVPEEDLIPPEEWDNYLDDGGFINSKLKRAQRDHIHNDRFNAAGKPDLELLDKVFDFFGWDKGKMVP